MNYFILFVAYNLLSSIYCSIVYKVIEGIVFLSKELTWAIYLLIYLPSIVFCKYSSISIIDNTLNWIEFFPLPPDEAWLNLLVISVSKFLLENIKDRECKISSKCRKI